VERRRYARRRATSPEDGRVRYSIKPLYLTHYKSSLETLTSLKGELGPPPWSDAGLSSSTVCSDISPCTQFISIGIAFVPTFPARMRAMEETLVTLDGGGGGAAAADINSV
jgi:hypothetical protein